MQPRVLFVSKPVVPPWTDGSKCLVRDIATHLTQHRAVIMTTADPVDPRLAQLETAAIYKTAGGFAPALRDNARVAAHLLFERSAALWNFVMAPSPRTSQVARFLRALRPIPVVQTIASRPRKFEGVASLLFGDVVVAQSEWTRAAIVAALPATGRAPELQVIPPPLAAVAQPSAAEITALRKRLEIADGAPLFVYPGDLEVSQGARFCAALVEPLVRAIPDAVVVFACREKTPHARAAREQLQSQLNAASVRFVAQIPDFAALLAAATAVLFPVDDLYGKVDLPIALLEALAYGIPVLALEQGPLLDLRGGAELLGPDDPSGWVAACVQLVTDPGRRHEASEKGRAYLGSRHGAGAVAAAYERIYAGLLSARHNSRSS
ncbi:MAG TPA: glycosyltransferase family 4 protein [Polyangiaceae bacterium]|nr:glycosyltransferase family 4 protein [Polyangiaceae bacterium]